MGSTLRKAILTYGCCIGFLVQLQGPAAAATFKVIHTFQNNGDTTDGSWPNGPLIRDAKGNLYGTTVGGGANGGGTVFELSPNPDGTWSESVLYSFTGGADGELPAAGLISDGDGNLYGTTQQGGFNGKPCSNFGYDCGTIFEVSPSAGSWTFVLLHSFRGYDGAMPSSTLALDADGNLYGITTGGGIYDNRFCFGGCGVAFELVRDLNWLERMRHKFYTPGDDHPVGGVVIGTDGNLYWSSDTGGLYAHGAIYTLRPTIKGPWKETILYSFLAGNDRPSGTPVLQDGGIYGATSYGGNKGGFGTVFHLHESATGWSLSDFSFDGRDGKIPLAPVLLQGGKIFGVTQQGGIVNGACFLYPDGNGVVYELTPGLKAGKVLYSFTGGSDGCGPSPGLVSDPQGHLYGATSQGGAAGAGVIFEVTP